MTNHEDRIRRILEEIETGSRLSCRGISRRLAISLGLTHQLLHGLVERRLVQVVDGSAHRGKYRLTSKGEQEKARMVREYLTSAVSSYAEVRERIGRRFDELLAGWTVNGGAEKRLVFYGAGDLAEIVFASVQQTKVRLVGIVDDTCSRNFFGLPVHPATRLTSTELDGQAFDHILVMSLDEVDSIRTRLEALGLTPPRVMWL